ncbi:MAG: TonB family protein [Acidobacteriota bacterium]
MCCKSFWKKVVPFGLAIFIGITIVGFIASYNYKSNIYSIVVKQQPVFLTKSTPKWTDEAKTNKVEGIVSLQVTFDELGKFKNVEVLQGLPFGLTESAIEAAKETEIEPYKFSENEVSISTTINYRFKLNN